MKYDLTIALALASIVHVCAHDAQAPLTTTSKEQVTETNTQQPLVEWQGNNAVIWVSNIAPTFFGQDATDYDYVMLESDDRPIEAVETLNHTVYSGASAYAVMVALLNTTMGGTMTDEEGQDINYLCEELGWTPAAHVPECNDID